jgi:hypothetical protein
MNNSLSKRTGWHPYACMDIISKDLLTKNKRDTSILLFTTLGAYKIKSTEIFNGNTPYPLLLRGGKPSGILLFPRGGKTCLITLLQ